MTENSLSLKLKKKLFSVLKIPMSYEYSYVYNLLSNNNNTKDDILYFFVEGDDDIKDNLCLIYESIEHKRQLISIGVFFAYNFAKSFLWRYGYFAYFFFHTRLMSPLLLFTTLYFIRKNKIAHMTNDGIVRYNYKRKIKNVVSDVLETNKYSEQLLKLKLNYLKN